MAALTRERMLMVRMSEAEAAAAHTLASHLGLTLSGVVRMLLLEKQRTMGIEVTRRNTNGKKETR